MTRMGSAAFAEFVSARIVAQLRSTATVLLIACSPRLYGTGSIKLSEAAHGAQPKRSERWNREHPLERVLERELHLPHGASGRTDRAKGRAAEIGVRESPHGMIQQIVGFPTELQ